jgi:hypothetical protein
MADQATRAEVQAAVDRSLQARAAVHKSWERTADPAARTAPARAKFLAKFEDPSIADPVERARRAEHAKRSYMLKLAAKSARVRRENASAK